MNTSVNASGTGDGPSSCFNADIRRVLCLDDFEEFRARASSGGSLYGILRRQALLRGTTASGKGPVPPGPGNRPMQRQRSKSLIQRSVALPEDKCILKMLCDYSEMTRKHMLNRENRRHSEAALVYNRKKSSPIRVPAAVRSISPYPGQASSSSNSHPQEPTRSSSPQPPQLQPSAAGPSTGASLLNPSDMAQLTLQCPRLSFCRRRSFSVTHNGVVNDGDDLVALPTALDPTDLDETTAGGGGGGGGSGLQVLGLPTLRSRQGSLYPVQVSDGKVVGESSNDDTGEELLLQGSFSCGDANTVAIHRVLMLGGPGVGKTALTQQFVTSEYMAAQNTSFDDGVEITIPVLLDGEESIVEFIDFPYNGELNTWRDYDVDGFIIVYSITDRRSYQKAVDLLLGIRSKSTKKPIILVANKSDLERSRLISKHEGRTVADTHDCKYIDVSAILNHRVDDLLVGILKQIRLGKETHIPKRKKPRSCAHDDSGVVRCFSAASNTCRNTLLTKLVRKSSRKHSKSCENLLHF